MNDEEVAGDDLAPEVVQSEVKQAEAAEAPDSTEGQDNIQPAEGDDELPEDEEVSKSKQRRERRKAEMQRLRDAEQQAKRDAQEAQKRLDAIREAAQSQQPPKETDFADYNDYVIAAAAYQTAAQLDQREIKSLEREAEARRQAAEQATRQTQQEQLESWNTQIEDARGRYQDFDQVALSDNVPITPQMARVIASSDRGADVAYYLGTHKQEAAKIAQIADPLDMARALGFIEARLNLPKPRTQTAAPDPLTPVRPKASAQKDPSKMTMEEWKAWRSTQ